MTEERKGVSAWLRGIIDECGVSGTQGCTAIAEAFDIDCKHERTCRDCITKMMTAIADLIDRPSTTRHGKFRTKYGRETPCCEVCGYSIGDMRWGYCPKCGAEVVE